MYTLGSFRFFSRASDDSLVLLSRHLRDRMCWSWFIGWGKPWATWIGRQPGIQDYFWIGPLTFCIQWGARATLNPSKPR